MACAHTEFVEGCPDCAHTHVPPSLGKLTEATFNEVGADLSRPPEKGTQVGRYVLLDQVGEGGMGFVFAAYDPELNRRVAIKLLRLERRDPRKVTAGQTRMLREAQAMAQLSDPHVVPVYDVGTYRDGVFLAMEFVEGQTLADWIRERAKHPWRQMLTVLRDAGAGLAAAHKAGLIHRDFKPANVLIGSDGRARVGDFGLARAENALPLLTPVPGMVPAVTEESLNVAVTPSLSLTPGGHTPSGALSTPLTVAGTMMGTPGYMAPEQYAGGAVNAGSDQFSFCVSLYEALYGARPFQASDVHRIADLVAKGQMLPPPKDTPVPSWVWHILQRGLAADPAKRFASMEALLAELGKDPAQERRRWMAVAAGVVLVAAAAVGARAYVVKQNQLCQGAAKKLAGAWDPATAESTHKALEATKLPYIPATWTSVRARLDEYAQRWTDTYVDACEATRRRGEQSEQVMDLRMQCLDDSRLDLAALTALFQKADAKIAENAVKATLSLPDLARCSDPAALREPVPMPTDTAVRAKINAAQEQLAQANTLFRAGKLKDARKAVEALMGPADTLGYPPLAARSYRLLADLEATLSSRSSSKAREWYERAFREAEAAHLDGIATAVLLEFSNEAVSDHGKIAEAKLFAELGHGTIARLRKPESYLVDWEAELGQIAHGEGKVDESIEHTQRALALAEPLNDPLVVSRVETELGWYYVDKGDLTHAQQQLEKALALREKLVGPDHPYVLQSLNALVRETATAGHFEEAMRYTQRTMALIDRVFGPEDARHCMMQSNLANVYLEWGDHAEDALREARAAAALCPKVLGADNPQYPAVLSIFGEALREAGHPQEALVQHRAAMEAFDRIHSTMPALSCLPFMGMAADDLAMNKGKDALVLAKQAVKCLNEGKVEGPNQSEALKVLGQAQLKLGDLPAAVASLSRVVALRTIAKEDPASIAEAKFLLAQAQWKTDRPGAAALAQDAERVYEERGKSVEVKQIKAWRVAHR
jgi:tetratricopeptide (TPR) repeat protein